jgi:hypothetical protein
MNSVLGGSDVAVDVVGVVEPRTSADVAPTEVMIEKKRM